MSLILGAVQFGVAYGVTNQKGKPNQDTAFAVIDSAWDFGIRVLDSAQAYGQANEVIAAYHATHKHRFSLINKVMRHPENPQEVIVSLQRECDEMGIDQFDCIMFHYSPSVPDSVPRSFLSDLKETGLTRRVGLSIDVIDNYHLIKDRFDLDVVQLPLNVMNQKFMPQSFLQELKQRGIEIHARSAFLQGVLLNKSADNPAYLAPIASLNQRYHDDCRALGITSLAGCLLFLLQNPLVDHIVVGAQDSAQLRDIIEGYKAAEIALVHGKSLDWSSYAVDDFTMVHPLSWLELAKKI